MRLSELRDTLLTAGIPIESLAYDNDARGLRINYTIPPTTAQAALAAQIVANWPSTEATLIVTEATNKAASVVDKTGLRNQVQTAITRLDQIVAGADTMTTAQLKTALADIAKIELALIKAIAWLI